MHRLNIQFEGRQVVIETDSADVMKTLEETYRHVAIGADGLRVGEITILQRPQGYEFRGPSASYELPSDVAILLHIVKQEVLSAFVVSTPELLWLHAGAVSWNGRALILPGNSGQGKSTFVTLLSECGWLVMSDDAAPIKAESFEVVPFPQQPVRRLHPGRIVPKEEIGELERESVFLPEALVATSPAELGAIVLPVFDGTAKAVLTRLRPGDAALELLRHCMSFSAQKGIAVQRVAAMSERHSVYKLHYGDARGAADLLATIL